MNEILQNLAAFTANGFRFPDHTVYIWSAYAVSFLTLLALFLWTQARLRREKRLAREFEQEKAKVLKT